ncbi:MAG: hypothetical protein MUO82_02820 [Candidatus Thermoplasmatota archaeon]|nr:hypothetical protein [Candidatus Thermoplasmatota archaeon]
MGLSPVISSNKTIEQKQSNGIVVNPQVSEIDDTNTFSLNEKELELLKNYILIILPTGRISDLIVYEIINLIKDKFNSYPSLLRKNLVISQGWGYNTNLFKNTRFQIKHDAFSFWHYAQDSKKGIESKTFVIRANNVISSRTIELYRGTQTGFMVRSIGLYFFLKNTFPLMSYTLFIGFASYVFVTAEEIVQIPFPLL